MELDILLFDKVNDVDAGVFDDEDGLGEEEAILCAEFEPGAKDESLPCVEGAPGAKDLDLVPRVLDLLRPRSAIFINLLERSFTNMYSRDKVPIFLAFEI